MKKKSIIITFTILGGILLAAGIVWGGISLNNSMNALGEYKSQLEYVYERNFYELSDNMNNIESGLAKLKVSTDRNVQQRYLASIVAQSNMAQNNIAVLPIEHNAINETTKFVNKLSGFCLVLQQKLMNIDKISDDDMEQIDMLHESSQSIKYELNRLATLISGPYSIVDNVKNPNKGESNFNNEFNGLNNEIVDYPQLIYDGPFSESTTNQEIKGLSQNIIDKEAAQARLGEWFNGYDVQYVSESDGGNFDTYNFHLTKGEMKYYAQITKRDGVLLQFNGSEEIEGERVKTEQECKTIAEEFIKKVGFGELQAVWSTILGNYAFVNLTPVENNVIIYPDMVKIKISLVTGDVVGVESKSWAYNHTTRNNFSPVIDEIQARQAVSIDSDIRTCKLSIIPNEYVGETLCYEFMCISGGNTYYVYIDAKTGEQANILKVVETEDGNLLM